MDELPAVVVERLRAMFAVAEFAVAEADRATAALREARAGMAARGMTPAHVERGLMACMLATQRRVAPLPPGEQTKDRRLAELERFADLAPSDITAVLYDADLGPVDPYADLDLAPAAYPLDLDFPEPLASVIHCCETRCVTACCGLDAYDIRADHVVRWVGQRGVAPLITALSQLEARLFRLMRTDGPVRGDDMLLNYEWIVPDECLRYFSDVWRPVLGKALKAVGGSELARPEWRTQTVHAIADGIVTSRDFSRLPVLADALDDAGCDHEPVLSHMRGCSEHAGFCWAADLFADA